MPTKQTPTPRKAKAPKPPPGPDDLVRKSAGEYESGDGRFTVRQSDASWYVVDNTQTNEFGQELIHGPYGSLKQARDQMPGARSVRPMLRSQPRQKPSGGTGRKETGSKQGRAKAGQAATPEPQPEPGRGPKPEPSREPRPEPKPPPSTWIDRLPPAEATEVRRLIRALEKEGLPDAEALVRRDRGGLMPAIATALLGRRLEAFINNLPQEEREIGRRIANEIGQITSASDVMPGPLPGWALFETGPGREPTKRRLQVGD